MLVGTNCDPIHGFVPADIVQSGVWVVRFPLSLGHDYGSFIAGCLGAQMDPVYVFHRDSFETDEWLDHTYRSRLAWWAEGLPPPRYIQAGNEPDGTGDSSSRMDYADYQLLCHDCRVTWPDATIIGAGLVGIDFNYFGVPHVDAEAFHPYTQTPDSLPALVAAIRQYTTKPLWATEVGVPKAFYWTAHERATWHSDMQIALWRLGIQGACEFPYAEIMEPNFDGMVDGNGDITEVWAAVKGAAESLTLDEPPADDYFIARLFEDIQFAVGLPYVFGGRAVPPQGGFDCTGFVLEAYHLQGYNLCYVPTLPNPFPEYATGKWYTNAQRLLENPKLTPISQADAVKGDIVFFERTYNTPGASHVVLVEDENTFLGAQSPVAGYVNWTNNSYWTSRLIGFRRVPR